MKTWLVLLCVGVAGLSMLVPDMAAGAVLEDLTQAVRDGETHFDFRYRFEHVDEQGFEKEADASTLRSRLTYSSAELSHFSFLVEADYVSVIGPEHYNSTVNGKTQYPTVADPDGFDLNQALIRFKTDTLIATLGRQRINHGSQRFVGGVGWRQNEQTYDGLRGEVTLAKRVHLDYSYLDNVNRVFGPDDGAQPGNWRSDTHLLRGSFDLNKDHQLVAVAYLMDFDNDNGPVNSNATYGLDYIGSIGPVGIKASVAQQSDYGSSPLNYAATYYLVEAKVSLPVAITLGYEVLGSDKGQGFRTPLATLHAFQGWADKFLNTPGTGVRDGYLGISGKIAAFSLGATYHDFSADAGGMNYGRELDLVATYTVNKNFTAQLKSAFYAADEFAKDTDKIWLTLQLKL